MSRILHVHPGNLFGGIETVLLNIARLEHGKISENTGLEHFFALSHEGLFSERLQKFTAAIHFFPRTRLRNPFSVWLARQKMRHIIRNVSPDFVFFHGSWGKLLFASLAHEEGAREIFWVHDVLSKRQWLDRYAAFGRPDGLIANSHFTLRSTTDLYSNIDSCVIHCPVWLSGIDTRCELRAKKRSELGIKDNEVMILQVGRMEPLKGARDHIKALATLQDVSNWKAFFVGGVFRPQEKEFLESLRTLAQSAGTAHRITFLGQRSDVLELMVAGDIFCQPNERPEAFGIVFIEALSVGLPIITYDLGGPKDFLNSSNACLVPPGDKTKLAQMLRELIVDKARRKEISTLGCATAFAVSDPERQGEKLAEFLRTIQERV